MFYRRYRCICIYAYTARCKHRPERTIAEEYTQGVYSYAYCGQGGLSWSIPYAAGVLAIGFQVQPEYTGEQMLNVLFKTGYMKDGIRFINPTRFVVTEIARLLGERLGIAPPDVIIIINEPPLENWGLRGQQASEMGLVYKRE